MPHEGHSANLIELRLIMGWINRHLSINIACPLLMDSRSYRTEIPFASAKEKSRRSTGHKTDRIGTGDKDRLLSRKQEVTAYQNRIKTPSIDTVELAD